MQKVVRLPLICEQTDKEGNLVDYKNVYKILWELQRETREIKNKSVQLCWEFSSFSSEYFKQNGEYPKEKDALSYTLSGFVYDKLKQGKVLYSSNISTSLRDVCAAFKNAKVDMLKGERSILSYKANQPLDLHNKAIKLENQNENFFVKLKLLNKKGIEKHNFANSEFNFKIILKDNSSKSILEHCVDNIYSISASKLIYNQKKKLWELNLSYSFDGKKIQLDENKILGVDLGVHYPICASVHGSFKRFIIDGGEVEAFRRRVEARKISLLRQGKNCGDGRVGHGYKKRTAPVTAIGDAIARFRDTANHKYSKALIDYAVKNQCGIIQMENLNGITSEAETFLKNWSYFDLQTKIEYKAKAAGIKVSYIAPQYTSQRCSKCGFIDKENRPTQARFKCGKCGFEENADYNASQNISVNGIDKVIECEL